MSTPSSSNPKRSMANWNLQAILSDLKEAWRLIRDPSVPTILKLLLPGAAFLYFIWPLDIPGPFDDIAILVLALRFFVQLASPNPTSAPPPSAPPEDANTIDTTWRVIKS